MTREQIQKMFTYQRPKAEQIPKYGALREQARALAEAIDASQPDSSEKSLAIAALSEAIMWANAGIARNT